MSEDRAAIRAAAPILPGAALMLSLAMGLRQSLGLFVQPAIKDLSILVAGIVQFLSALPRWGGGSSSRPLRAAG